MHAQKEEANNDPDKICKDTTHHRSTTHLDDNTNEEPRSTTAKHKRRTAKHQSTTHKDNRKTHPGDRTTEMFKNNIK